MHRTIFSPIIFFILFLLTSCGSYSLEDFEEEGKGVIRSLVQELKSIHTREQLKASSAKLQRLFDQLVTVIIAAKEFSESHPELDSGTFLAHQHELSDQLRTELNRIYRFEGGRQMIEKCQEKALNRLDAFEKKSSRHKEDNRLLMEK